MIMVCALNNRARILNQSGTFKNQGEPTEAALKVLAEKLGKYTKRSVNHEQNPNAHSDAYENEFENVATLDFSSERKTMSTIIKGANGTNVVLLKGAPERVLAKCNGIVNSNDAVVQFKSDSEKQELLKKINHEASKGFRVLGIAIAKDGGKMKHINKSNIEQELSDANKFADLESDCQFVGYVCIRDPPRDEVKESIDICRTAGVNVIMITGDAKETAIAIAKELNILSSNQ